MRLVRMATALPVAGPGTAAQDGFAKAVWRTYGNARVELPNGGRVCFQDRAPTV
ncbi:hypothetical protein M8542_40810 [Amycolatopsis sp. OK19-0408]|uniref:Uncharacterized protein n=1 Tax=Amycolatopsis iheyensis TaxID=2945988 RepID=A0A9X2NM92_9PSEU|nr:hypothetical protein [Amycolatopsis iheyensis]MCR6489184.1 hypothetical protein [Amycolatopsis iheyensis]